MSRHTLVLRLWTVLVVASAMFAADVPAGERARDLAAPVRIMAGGESIHVAGYAAPFVGDFDGDGTIDLLVGQMDRGGLRIYRNTGTNARPVFEGFTWFKAGGREACIPSG